MARLMLNELCTRGYKRRKYDTRGDQRTKIHDDTKERIMRSDSR
jgi:hypothetical protein